MRIADPLLATGTPDEQMRKWREAQRQEITRGIVATKNEIPRDELDFESLGGRLIEHLPTGHFYLRFDGDPAYVGDDVRDYFMDARSHPVMLQRSTNPSSRAELEQKRAAREQRKAAKEAYAKQRREQLRAGAR